MGWTSYHTERSTKDEIIYSLERYGHKVLKYAAVNGAHYAAVLELNSNKVFGYVALVRRSSTYENFCIKEMDDTMGPCYYDCPAAILDLLSPTESEFANNWRKKCRECANILKVKNMKPGCIFKLKSAINYGIVGHCSYFLCTKSYGKKTYFIKKGTGIYRVKRQRDLLNAEIEKYIKAPEYAAIADDCHECKVEFE